MSKKVPLPDFVYLVIKEYPDIYMEIERAFIDPENAHDYIVDRYPYYTYYTDYDMYAMPDLSEEELGTEERYFILERPISD